MKIKLILPGLLLLLALPATANVQEKDPAILAAQQEVKAQKLFDDAEKLEKSGKIVAARRGDPFGRGGSRSAFLHGSDQPAYFGKQHHHEERQPRPDVPGPYQPVHPSGRSVVALLACHPEGPV